MRLLVGTNGFHHEEWRGAFYPDKLKSTDMLGYYALRLRTVEVQSTFYGIPKPELLRQWASATPADFVFALEASRRITYRARLENVAESVRELYSRTQLLGHKLGPVLFQCPPNLRKDVGLLDAFLASLPVGARAAIEFRSRSWYDDDVLAALERHDVALCITDWDDPTRSAPLVPTARFGYLRLRATSYSDDAIDDWVERVLDQPWGDAFVYFQQKDGAVAPRLALRMLEALEASPAMHRTLVKTPPPPAPLPPAPVLDRLATLARGVKPLAKTRARPRTGPRKWRTRG